MPTGNTIAGIRETEYISEFDEDAAITALRTLVLAEVEKLTETYLHEETCRCEMCMLSLKNNVTLAKVKQSLTKLFEGGKEK